MQLRAAIWTNHPFALNLRFKSPNLPWAMGPQGRLGPLAKGSAGKNIRALTTLGAGPASVY